MGPPFAAAAGCTSVHFPVRPVADFIMRKQQGFGNAHPCTAKLAMSTQELHAGDWVELKDSDVVLFGSDSIARIEVRSKRCMIR
jgi:hypothetical protein